MATLPALLRAMITVTAVPLLGVCCVEAGEQGDVKCLSYEGRLQRMFSAGIATDREGSVALEARPRPRQ